MHFCQTGGIRGRAMQRNIIELEAKMIMFMIERAPMSGVFGSDQAAAFPLFISSLLALDP